MSSKKTTRQLTMLILWGMALALLLTACGAAVQTPDLVSPTSALSATPLPLTATFTPEPTAPVSPIETPTLTPATDTSQTIFYTYEIVNVYPHDRDSFTQGLVYVDGELYEGSGLYGRSSLRRVDLETGEVLQIHRLPAQFFGEGIAIWKDKIIQLTWKANTGFVYDKATFEQQQQFIYPTEGWGITHDGEQLIMSDGTASLYFLDPETFRAIDRVEVHDAAGPVVRLNELEYIDGEVYANVWQSNRIARIDPETGWVTGWIDLTGLLTAEDRSEPVDVLNGIAYDAANDRLFVTGKLWPKLFEIELVEGG